MHIRSCVKRSHAMSGVDYVYQWKMEVSKEDFYEPAWGYLAER